MCRSQKEGSEFRIRAFAYLGNDLFEWIEAVFEPIALLCEPTGKHPQGFLAHRPPNSRPRLFGVVALR